MGFRPRRRSPANNLYLYQYIIFYHAFLSSHDAYLSLTDYWVHYQCTFSIPMLSDSARHSLNVLQLQFWFVIKRLSSSKKMTNCLKDHHVDVIKRSSSVDRHLYTLPTNPRRAGLRNRVLIHSQCAHCGTCSLTELRRRCPLAPSHPIVCRRMHQDTDVTPKRTLRGTLKLM